MNVALYARGASAWSLEERVLADADRAAGDACFGASAMAWDEGSLLVTIDQPTTRFGGAPGSRIRGHIRVYPELLPGAELVLDARGAHRWWPIAPLSRIEVALEEPALRFSGHGYLDANAGEVPLEASFSSWSWARARFSEGAIIAYDIDELGDGGRSIGMLVRPSGRIERDERSTSHSLASTLWGLERRMRVDPGAEARVVRTLEDGPSYARTLVETRLWGHDVVAMHETLDARRLGRRWSQFLTGFRTGRAT